MPEDSEESTKFIRQRRDLFVISGLLLLIEFADITVNQISLIGMSVNVGNPIVLKYSLWIIWGYWYLRYIQAFLALRRNLANEVYRNLRYKFVITKFKSTLTKENQEIWRLRAKEQELDTREYDLIKDPHDSQFRWHKASINYRLIAHKRDGSVSHVVDARVDVISGLPYIWIQVKAISELLIKNIEFTEYILPFIFGLLPPVTLIVRQYFC